MLFITIGPGDFRRNTWPPSFFWGREVSGHLSCIQQFFSSQQFVMMIGTLLEFLSAFLFLFWWNPNEQHLLSHCLHRAMYAACDCWGGPKGRFFRVWLVRGLVKWQVAS